MSWPPIITASVPTTDRDGPGSAVFQTSFPNGSFQISDLPALLSDLDQLPDLCQTFAGRGALNIPCKAPDTRHNSEMTSSQLLQDGEGTSNLAEPWGHAADNASVNLSGEGLSEQERGLLVLQLEGIISQHGSTSLPAGPGGETDSALQVGKHKAVKCKRTRAREERVSALEAVLAAKQAEAEQLEQQNILLRRQKKIMDMIVQVDCLLR